MTDKTKGYLATCLSACILGCQATLNRLLILEGIEPISLGIIKMVFAMTTIFFILLIKKPKDLFIERKDIHRFIIYGVITVGIYNFFYMNSLEMTNVVTTTILVYTSPIFVVIISAIFLGEELTRAKLIAIIMAFIGCFIVAGGTNIKNLNPNPYGILFGLGAGFCLSLWVILGKRLLNKYSPWTVVLYGNAIGAISLLFFRNPIYIANLEISLKLMLYIYAVTFITMIVGTSIYYYGLSYIESSKSSIISNLEPVVSVVLAYFVLGESLSVYKLIGFILIIASILLIIYEDVNKYRNFDEKKTNGGQENYEEVI